MAIFGAVKTVVGMMSGYGAANVVGRWCMAAKPVNGRAFDTVCHFLGMCGLEFAAWDIAEKAVTNVFDNYHDAGVNIKNAVTKKKEEPLSTEKKEEPLSGDVDKYQSEMEKRIIEFRATAERLEKEGKTEAAEALKAVADAMTKELREMVSYD